MGLLEISGGKSPIAKCAIVGFGLQRERMCSRQKYFGHEYVEGIKSWEDIVGCGPTANYTRWGHCVYVLRAFLLSGIWSPIELCFCDGVRGIGGLHNKPIAAERVLSERDDAYGGWRDSVEMVLDMTRW